MTLLSSKGNSKPSSAVETILLMCLNYLTICTDIQRTGWTWGGGNFDSVHPLAPDFSPLPFSSAAFPSLPSFLPLAVSPRV